MPRLKPTKSVHGEPLTRTKPFEGTTLKRFFVPKDVWCPTCGAHPFRRCTWDAYRDRQEQAGPEPAFLALLALSTRAFVQKQHRLARAGRRPHAARSERATALSCLAKNGEALLNLAYRPEVRPAQKPAEWLPLFQQGGP